MSNFKDLPTTRDHYVETPGFSCNGHQWYLKIFPGAGEDDQAGERYASIVLFHGSEGSITACYRVVIIDTAGKNNNMSAQATDSFEGKGHGRGVNYLKRSDILEMLDSDGTLTVDVSMKEEPSDVFVPKNPLNKLIQRMFLNEDTADVCFEVSNAEAKIGEKRKKAEASELFHAHSHSQILKTCAPMLANLFDLDASDGKIAVATIDGVKPDIFRHILYYVYGGSVPEEELKTHTKDIIDAANMYSIINLKLEAETVYVNATNITMDNAMDNLLYADAMNCALLKEAVMNFLAENSSDASEKISFNDVPGLL